MNVAEGGLSGNPQVGGRWISRAWCWEGLQHHTNVSKAVVHEFVGHGYRSKILLGASWINLVRSGHLGEAAALGCSSPFLSWSIELMLLVADHLSYK
jgi:hypothetical protein